MLAIRVKFKKEGLAKYISHLDLNRYMQRALRRAHIPIWNTQGYNPHPYIVFAMPLSIFFESDCEIMDARLDEDMPLEKVKSLLSAQMPDGLRIISVTQPEMKLSEIGYAAYSISLDYDGRTKEQLDEITDGIKSADKIIVEKQTKRSTKEIDIKEYFESAEIKTADGGISMNVVLPAGTQETLNPSYLVTALEKFGKEPDFQHVRRLAVYNGEMQPFL